MGVRGPGSTAALSIIGPSGVDAVRRPSPPAELTEEQSEEWNVIINRLPADWFARETHGLLAAYCRHIVSQRHIAQLIATMEGHQGKKFDVHAYDQLLKMQQRESLCISMLAVKMRIAQQSTYDKSKKKPVQDQTPWHKAAK